MTYSRVVFLVVLQTMPLSVYFDLLNLLKGMRLKKLLG